MGRLLAITAPWRRCALWFAAPTVAVSFVTVMVSSWVAALLVTLTVVVLGTLTAYALADSRPSWRRVGGSAARSLALGWGLFGTLFLLATAWPLALVCLVAGLAIAAVVAGRGVLEARREICAWMELAVLTDQSRVRRKDLVADVSDRGLGTVWHRSGQLMSRPGDVATRMEYLQVREQVLDELEARDPDAFARWLEHPDETDLGAYLGDRAA